MDPEEFFACCLPLTQRVQHIQPTPRLQKREGRLADRLEGNGLQREMVIRRGQRQ